MRSKLKVAVIVPLLNESQNISRYYYELKKTTTELKKYKFSYLFVDDGSSDDSWDKIIYLTQHDKQVSAIKFSRNFGSHSAWYAGIKAVKEVDACILTTIDLQDPLILIPVMLEKFQNGAKLVCAVRRDRKDILLTKILSQCYYFLVKKFALPNMPSGGVDFCLIAKKIIQDLIEMGEKNTSLIGLILWLGYSYAEVFYVRNKRRFGKSKWTIFKKVKLFIDTFVGFSFMPIRLVSYLGFLFSTLGFLYAIIIFVRRIIYGAPIEGWSSLMLVVLILSGVQLITLGIVAEYLWRTLDASRQRPLYVIEKQVNL